MDDLTLFNLVSLAYFFSRFSYHNLIIKTLGKFGPNCVAMSVCLIFHYLIRKFAFNPQFPLLRQAKTAETKLQITARYGSHQLPLGRTLIFADLLLCISVSHRHLERGIICSLLHTDYIPDDITIFLYNLLNYTDLCLSSEQSKFQARKYYLNCQLILHKPKFHLFWGQARGCCGGGWSTEKVSHI